MEASWSLASSSLNQAGGSAGETQTSKSTQAEDCADEEVEMDRKRVPDLEGSLLPELSAAETEN